MAILKKKDSDIQPLIDKEKRRVKNQLENFQEHVSIPLHLSLPFYIVTSFLLFSGLFIILHCLFVDYLNSEMAGPAFNKFFTITRKTFGDKASIQHIRWKYYIPTSVFSETAFLHSLYIFFTGVLFVLINKTLSRLYVRKKVDEEIDSKRR